MRSRPIQPPERCGSSTRLAGEMNSRRRRTQLFSLTARPRSTVAVACSAARRAFISPPWSRSEQSSTAVSGRSAGDREPPRDPRPLPHHRGTEQSFLVPCAPSPEAPIGSWQSGRAVGAARQSGVRPRRDLPHVRIQRRSGRPRPPGTCREAGSGAPARRRGRSGRVGALVREPHALCACAGALPTAHRGQPACAAGPSLTVTLCG